MPDMKDLLSEIYGGTTVTKEASAPVATPEDLQKQAQVEYFTKLCSAKQIDVSLLNDSQVQELFKTAMELKVAEEAEESAEAKAKKVKDEADKKSKEASAVLSAADAEYQEKRAAAAKVAEADMMGRIMAHAYVDELAKLAGEMPPQFAAGKKNDKEEKTEKTEDGDDKEKAKKEASARAAAVIAEFEKTKTAGATPSTPSLDEVAGNRAIDMLKAAGVNADLAMARINAVHVLGVPDGAKVASAANLDAAVHVRALEYCEAAGFPVDWDQV
jgi:hypothetical protein